MDLSEMRPIPGYSYYYADRHGGIWSVRQGFPHRLSQFNSQCGEYWQVCLYEDDGSIRNGRQSVGRLVLMAWVGMPPEGMECCHGPRGKKCNDLDNLRWDTKSENALDRFRFGNPATPFTPGHTLTPPLPQEKQELIVKHANEGRPVHEIAKLAGVSGVAAWKYRKKLAPHTARALRGRKRCLHPLKVVNIVLDHLERDRPREEIAAAAGCTVRDVENIRANHAPDLLLSRGKVAELSDPATVNRAVKLLRAGIGPTEVAAELGIRKSLLVRIRAKHCPEVVFTRGRKKRA